MLPVAAARVRSAGRGVRMQAAPAPPTMAPPAHRAAQARRSVAVLTDRAAPAPPSPRMLRLRVAARRNPPSAPCRLPARHRRRLRVRHRGNLRNAPVRPLRHPSDRLARQPRSVNGSASVPGSRHLQPQHHQARRPLQLRLQRLSPHRLRHRPSSGLPQARPARPMRSARPGRVTRSARIASAPVTSVPARMLPPRPLPRRRLHRPLPQPPLQHPRLRRLRQRLRQHGRSRLRPLPRLRRPQRELNRRHLHRPRRHLSRQRLPQPSRWTPPASASRTCAASVVSAVRAAG